MKWISVKEKLPDKAKKYYLVLIDTRYIDCIDCENKISHVCKLNFKPYKYDVAYWNANVFCETYFSSDNITHWMTFPNQPERLSERASKDDAIV